MRKYNISIFEDKYRSKVIDLWDQCNLIKSWNDPNKDIDKIFCDNIHFTSYGNELVSKMIKKNKLKNRM